MAVDNVTIPEFGRAQLRGLFKAGEDAQNAINNLCTGIIIGAGGDPNGHWQLAEDSSALVLQSEAVPENVTEFPEHVDHGNAD